jgi:hypothetical protein
MPATIAPIGEVHRLNPMTKEELLALMEAQLRTIKGVAFSRVLHDYGHITGLLKYEVRRRRGRAKKKKTNDAERLRIIQERENQ